ncbi:MAG: endolytic transglycosylase MltG [Candidatus Peregrinibacteria bacterium]|nr:endolytic transglycosylase MltG [Candidatus Peregrinibacteria bacterium]
MKKFILLVIIFLGIYFSGRLLLVWDRPNSDIDTRVSFEIEPGSSLTTISELLYEKGLIRDAFAFRVFSKYKGFNSKFQAGEFIIQKNLTFEEISEILQHGKSSEIKVTIPEGSTIEQIDDILARRSLIKAGEFSHCASFCNFSFKIDSLEGYLFPSTYFVNPNTFSEKKFIGRLYENFRLKIKPYHNEILESGRTLNEIVIVASMIEREANNYAEMSKISDVIWKRLDEGIHLGIDATTRYEKNNWKTPLYTEDFESNSPYNTRRTLGLPPTAISNFSTESFVAALHPEKNPYYYYLHDSKGVIHFAKDLAGHNANKARYLY